MTDNLTVRELPVAESSPLENPNPARLPLNMTQKTMARRMQQSARDIPQFSVSMELDADKLAACRSQINSEIENQARRVSVTALLIWLTARTLLKHPRLNAQFDQDAIIQHNTVSMAVATDTPEGLTAPVIQQAETLSWAVNHQHCNTPSLKIDYDKEPAGSMRITRGLQGKHV